MSYSRRVKEELVKQFPKARHCQIAELAVYIMIYGKLKKEPVRQLKLQTENSFVFERVCKLLSVICKLNLQESNKEVEVDVKTQSVILSSALTERLSELLKITDAHMDTRKDDSELIRISHRLYELNCCKRSVLRAAFLSSGSLTNPEKKYHFEIALTMESRAVQLQQIMNDFDMDAKIVIRKKYFVLYVKEAERIADLLNIMGAHVALLDMENVRILKEMRNSVNRQVNCEVANSNKVVVAASHKIDDIEYIKERCGLSYLGDPGLIEIAGLRLSHPDASLKELGEMLSRPIGKSGVNHRLRKISEAAERLRKEG